MLLFVYTTTHKRFVIFTCRYFKLSRNTTALSQSNCTNFLCSGIKKGRELSRFKESFVRGVGEFYCTLRVLYGKYSSIISNVLIHVMWFYCISLPHRFSGAAPCPKYDTCRGVMLSLHAGILLYLRILVFFCHNLSSKPYMVVKNQWERMLLPR